MAIIRVPLVIINGRIEDLPQNEKIPNCTETLKFEFVTPAAVWVIEHNLDKYPSVSTVTAVGQLVYGSVEYVNSNKITVTFTKPFAGRAYIN
jgi:hypothetical protein